MKSSTSVLIKLSFLILLILSISQLKAQMMYSETKTISNNPSDWEFESISEGFDDIPIYNSKKNKINEDKLSEGFVLSLGFSHLTGDLGFVGDDASVVNLYGVTMGYHFRSGFQTNWLIHVRFGEKEFARNAPLVGGGTAEIYNQDVQYLLLL